MNKLTIIFGGFVDLYRSYFNVFNEVEKEFGIKIRRKSPYLFSGKLGKILIEFRFCFHPIRDENYKVNKKYQEEGLGKELVPDSAEDLVKKINSEAVIFAGLCGVFKGKKNQIFIPEKFSEILFDSIFIKKTSKIKLTKTFSRKNFLKKLGKTSHAITSNVTLSPVCIEGNSSELLIKIGKELSKEADHVDKEVYSIAKGLKKNVLFGAFLLSSDIITVRKHMIDKIIFAPNKNLFNKTLIKSIKTMVKDDE
ncbi:MAG: hypothetical protein KKF50_00525 [Nanoarchaeota archaeon]|nr:hypothetical protein [Nanoarchaeota archaeon]